jgi:hypothetical protein
MSHVQRRPRVALLVAALVAGAIFVATGAFTPGGARASAVAPSAAALNGYSIFSRPAQSLDAVSAIPQLPSGALTRRQPSPYAGISQWASVSGDEVCVFVKDAATGDTDGACNSAEYLASHHELLVERAYVGGSATPPTDQQANLVAGLAPDGVTSVSVKFADGSHVSVPVEANGFVYSLGSGVKKVSGVAWTTSSGEALSQ